MKGRRFVGAGRRWAVMGCHARPRRRALNAERLGSTSALIGRLALSCGASKVRAAPRGPRPKTSKVAAHGPACALQRGGKSWSDLREQWGRARGDVFKRSARPSPAAFVGGPGRQAGLRHSNTCPSDASGLRTISRSSNVSAGATCRTSGGHGRCALPAKCPSVSRTRQIRRGGVGCRRGGLRVTQGVPRLDRVNGAPKRAAVPQGP